LFGLGNPGDKYLLTRHNLGFMFLDLLALRHRLKFKKQRYCSTAEGDVMGRAVTLCKPLGFMNNSGPVIRRFLDRAFPTGHYEADSFAIICDDLNLPLGRIKLYRRGTDGGHLGLRSIIETLDTISFISIRMGIGPPPETDWSDFVLDEFADNEVAQVWSMLERAVDGIHLLFNKGLAAAQTFLNTKPPEL
jgi:PTH1 family peptidyl-tRNA hydrolase